MGLVLRRFAFGESSLVVHVLTPERGAVALLAKGAYRPSSGFFGVLDLFDGLELRWTERPLAELGLLTAAAIASRRPGLSADLARYRAGLSLLELATLAAREAHEERELFRWLSAGLDLLQRPTSDPGLVLLACDLAFLRNAGLAPALDVCAACGARPRGERTSCAFSTALGGRLCPRCSRELRARGGSHGSLPLNVLRVASSLMEATPGMLERTHLEDGLKKRLRSVLEPFLEHHLEAPLKSRRSSPERRR